MKKAINAWTVPPDVPFRDMFRQIAAAGYDGIELNLDEHAAPHALTMDTTPAQAAEISRLAEEFRLPVHSVSSSLYSPETLGSDNPARREKARDILRKQLELAHALGVQAILVVPGGVGPGRSLARAWDNCLESLSGLKEEVIASSIKVGLENVWNGFFLSPWDMARFIDSLDCPSFGAYFDVGNVRIFSHPEHWIEILGSRIVKVHVKDFACTSSNGGHFVNLLEGSVCWQKVMEALRASGYDGYLTAEVESLKAAQYQYAATALGLEHILNL